MGRNPLDHPFAPFAVTPPDRLILLPGTVVGHRIVAEGGVVKGAAELVPRAVVGKPVAVRIGHHPHHAGFGTSGKLVARDREIISSVSARRLDAVVESHHHITAEPAQREHAPLRTFGSVQPAVGILQRGLRGALAPVEPHQGAVEELPRRGTIGDHPVAVRRTAFVRRPGTVGVGHHHTGTIAPRHGAGQQEQIYVKSFHGHLKQKAVGVIPTFSVSNPRPSGAKRYTTPCC